MLANSGAIWKNSISPVKAAICPAVARIPTQPNLPYWTATAQTLLAFVSNGTLTRERSTTIFPQQGKRGGASKKPCHWSTDPDDLGNARLARWIQCKQHV